ncbi:MAG: DUF4191 domain-containing protein [Candidatus Planktophila sp.]
MFKKKKKEPKIREPRFKAIRDAYSLTKSVKPWIGSLLALIFITVLAAGVGVGFAIDHPYYLGFISLPLAALAALFVFSRIALGASFASVEGQLGAAASVLMAIRKGWTTTPAVAVNKNQDMVHRSVGRAGIVLTAEGSIATRQLLQSARKDAERFAPGVPIYEIWVGDGEGQVPLRKLQKHVGKFKKSLSAHQMREVRARLKAVGGMSMPIPKGPIPKNIRVPKR